jgi:hypothetical protein
LLKSLKKTILAQLERFPDSKEAKLLSHDDIVKATEISDFENAVIAPIFGFRNNVDYYRKTSCINFLDDIQVPTLILNAADDPFFDPTFFPSGKGCDSITGQRNRSPIKLVRTKYGGHLGFMFHQCNETQEEMEKEASFMPTELARFINHIFDYRGYLEKAECIWQYARVNNQPFLDRK